MLFFGKIEIMKKLSLYVFLVLLFFPLKLYAKTFSWKDYSSNVKKMQIKSKKMQALLNEILLKISENCCEKNFQNQERLLQIEINMNACLEEECHKKGFLFYKKKPQKLLVLEQVEEAKNLLLENSKLKYENEIQIKKKKRLEEEEVKRLEEEETSRLKEEAKLEKTLIKDQERTAEDDKKKSFHEAMERERAEKLKKIGITKRKKK